MNGRLLMLAAALAACTAPVAAKEGVDQFRPGADTFDAGVLPDAGWHVSNDLTYSEAFDSWAIGHGAATQYGYIDASEWRNTIRLTYVTGTELLGAAFAWRVDAPLVWRDVASTLGSDNFTSVGDIAVTPMLGWQHGNLHVTTGMSLYLPTGRVDQNAPGVSSGANYYSIEPFVGLTYRGDRFEASARLAHNLKGKNLDTDYRSGQEIRADYMMGWRTGGWTFGLSGWWVEQNSLDESRAWRAPGEPYVPLHESDAFAIGPMARYVDDAGRSYSLELLKVRGGERQTTDSQVSLKISLPF